VARMECMRRLAVVLAVLVCLAPAPLAAATKGVKVADSFFKPGNVAVRVGDSVRWTAPGALINPHNVREMNKLFYSGAVQYNIDFKKRFSAGSFRYFCELHVSTDGMRGVVNVPVTVSSAPQGLPFTVRWATGKSRTGGKYDVQFRVGTAKRWRNWKANVTSGSGVFGKGRKPAVVVNGKKYSFRARSQNKKGSSGWSQPRTFRA
jgi:plastocyanin